MKTYTGKEIEKTMGVPIRTIQRWATDGKIGEKIFVPLGHGFYWQYDEKDLRFVQNKAKEREEKK